MSTTERPNPVLPAWGGGSIADVLDAVLAPSAGRRAGPLPTLDPSRSRVLLVLDGLGAEQLDERRSLAPTLSAMQRSTITSVAPSTTATALTSLTTGLTPGEHGVVGYRMRIGDQVLNSLRWRTDDSGDARKTIPADSLQPYDPFFGRSVPHVSKAEFRRTGFTQAHLRGSESIGYRTPALLSHHVGAVLRGGAEVVYAYWDGVDKVSHEYGLGTAFDAELAFADRLVADVIDASPTGTQVVVTADHGQVHCAAPLVTLDDEVLELVAGQSGEARFRWLHARAGAAAELLAAAIETHGDIAWVVSRDEAVANSWFGPSVRTEVLDRYGDVALVPFEPTGFDDPADGGPFPLIGRHGSLTPAEMLVPLLVAEA